MAACFWSARCSAAGPRPSCAQDAPAPAQPPPAGAPQPRRPRPRRAGCARAARRHHPLDPRRGRPAPRAGDDPLLRQPASRPDLYRRDARPGAEGPLRDRAVRRRRHHRRRHRQPGHHGARESGHQPHRPRGQQAASRTTRSCRRSSSRRARSSPARRSAPTSPGSSSCTSARAASPPRSSRRSSSSTRTASTWCSRSTRAPKSKVRAINIIGNEQFRDGRLREEMCTKRGRRPARLPQLERQLRSRSARRRPAEAARLLPDRRAMPISASSRRSPS